MKIDFAGTPICSGESTASPKDFQIKGTRQVQTSEPLRAVQAINRDRGNVKQDVEFTLFRSHGTIQSAEYFALTHQASLPGSGTLILTADDGSHKSVQISYLANCVLESVNVRYSGMNSFTTYTFRGGQNQKAKP